MYNKFVTGLAVLFTTVVPALVNAQYYCGTDQVHRALVAAHPEILQKEAELRDFTNSFTANYINGLRNGRLIIPIVFHIIHRGGAENITDEQVRDQVRILNEDFNKLNPDTSDVIAEFKNVIGDVGLEFRLPALDPDGNPTNGIEHIYSSQTYQGRDYSKLNPWPREKYLNIWVVNSMESGVAGYAYYPASVAAQGEIPARDGIIILDNYIGSIGTSRPGSSRALTHEVGHYLNLKHVWGDTNDPGVACGNDDVNDTPDTKGWNHCPAESSSDVCNPGTKENYQNFMEYSYCSRMFSEGQKVRMLATLNSSISGRNNLWSPANLAATGTENLVAPTAPPIADFSVNKFFVCAGDLVTFSDDSYNDSIISRLWTFPDADVLASVDKKPKVAFYSEGWQQVNLTVEGKNGTASKTTALVHAADADIQFGTPYIEDFENTVDVNRFWIPVNVDRDAPRFQYTGITGHSGAHAMMLNNFTSRTDHNVDELISPAFECSDFDNTNAKVSFYYSYASWSDRFQFGLADSMAIYVTKNCGANWTKIFSDGSNAVVNAGYVANNFVPGADGAYWRKITATIPATHRTSKVRFKIVIFGAHNSNNFYIDDFQVGLITTGVENEFRTSLSVLPNPFTSNIQVSGLQDKAYDVSVYDLTGRQVFNISKAIPFDGNLNLYLSAIDEKGVYIIKVSDEKSSGVLKLVKQ